VIWDLMPSFVSGTPGAAPASGSLTHNTYQVLITNAEAQPGRSAGDVDVTFNYDAIGWDAPTQNVPSALPAWAGLTSGAADAVYSPITGSLTAGALADTGTTPLVERSYRSGDQPGRYTFEVRNADFGIALGTASGTVKDTNGIGLGGISVTLQNGVHTYTATSSAAGTYSLTNLRPGTYHTYVWWQSTQGYIQDSPLGDVVIPSAGGAVTVPPVVLRVLAGLPTGVTLSTPHANYAAPAVPTVNWSFPFTFQLAGWCTGGTGTFQFLQDGAVVASGSFVERPAGTYTASIGVVYPTHGYATIQYLITCASGAMISDGFDVYIDPAGTVVDQYGTPLAGATVTLLYSPTEDGVFTAAASYSPQLDPATPVNPVTTAADGAFHWDVAPGWYKVTAAYPGADSVTTGAMEVPEERTGLVLSLTVPGAAAPAPTAAPTVTGTVKPGASLTADAGTWPAGVAVTSITWLVDGVPAGTGTSFTVPADAGGKALAFTVSLVKTVAGLEAGLATAPKDFVFPFTYTVTLGTAVPDATTTTTDPGSTAPTPIPNTAGGCTSAGYPCHDALAATVVKVNVAKGATLKIPYVAIRSDSTAAKTKVTWAVKGKAVRVQGSAKAKGSVKAKLDATSYLKVKGIKTGTSTITLKLANGNALKLQVTVRAKAVAAKKVTVKAKPASLLKAGKLTLTRGQATPATTLKATVKPAKATGNVVTWTSSNPKIATIDAAGRVTAKAKGKTTLKAKSGQVTTRITLTVK
jgi:hypothetical protein